MIGGPELGLVLGGGAVLGAAHAGVLEVLEDAGISCPIVVGTSSGALVGAAYAAGLPSRVITEAVMAATWADFAQFNLERRWGLLDTSPIEAHIEKVIPTANVEDLLRRFGAVAWDLRTRQPALLTTGLLSEVLRATSALPGLFPPVRIGDQLLVDGMLADNLPVWAARLLGADIVLAIDLHSGTHIAAAATERVRETLHSPRHPMSHLDTGAADVVIRPDTSGTSRWSPRDVPKLIAAGRQTAQAALPSIIAALATQSA